MQRLAQLVGAWSLCLLVGVACSEGSGSDPDAGTGDPDGGGDPFPEGDPIDDFGTTDLDYDATPLPNPAENLPTLEGVYPEYTPALADQSLPGDSVQIVGLEEVAWYMGYDDAQLGELADALRENGVVRQLDASHEDLMTELMIEIETDWEAPGVLVTSDALFNTFHNFFDNLLLAVEVRTLRPELDAMLTRVKAEAAMRDRKSVV